MNSRHTQYSFRSIRSISDVMHVDLIDRHDQSPAVLQRNGHQLPPLLDLMAGAGERLQDVVGNRRRHAPQPLFVDVVALDRRHVDQRARAARPTARRRSPVCHGLGVTAVSGDAAASRFPAGRAIGSVRTSLALLAIVARRARMRRHGPTHARCATDPSPSATQKAGRHGREQSQPPGPRRPPRVSAYVVGLGGLLRDRSAISPSACFQHCASRNAKAQRRQPPGSSSSRPSNSRRSSSLSSSSTSRSNCVSSVFMIVSGESVTPSRILDL